LPDNLVINVRQISQYPARNPVDGSDLVLLQAGGLGGPYYSATASALFTTAGISPSGPFVWGVNAPADAVAAQLMSGALSLPNDGSGILFNLYANNVGSASYLSTGPAAQFSMTTAGVIEAVMFPPGTPGTVPTGGTTAQTLSPAGHLTLADTLTVARDPTAALEVATMGYVTAHTVASWNGRSGAVTMTIADITGAGGAPIASPVFTGTPSGPTAAPGTATTELATTAFVTAAIAAVSPDVHSFNGRSGVVTFLTADFNAATAILTDPVPTAPTAAPGNSSTQLATTAFVAAAIAAAVVSFNGRTGAITLTAADLTAAGGALLASPAFSGTPNAPTAVPGTSTGQLATTAFVQAAVAASTTGVSSWNTRTGAVVLNQSDIVNANGWASPSFTGVPLAPTATTPTNNTQIATTAFVHAAITAAVTGVTSFNTRTGAVVLTLADVTGVGGAALASPSFTGTPTANTAVPGTNTTQLATTAFVAAALAAISTGVTSFNGRVGAITLQGNDISAAGGVVSASPAFTGVPTAPTATTGDSSFQLATTQFVAEAIAAGVSGVSTWNGRAGAVTMVVGDITAAGGAPVASPNFTGVPQAPTATAGTSTPQLATTAFVAAALAAAIAPLAPIASPTFTGTVTIPAGAAIAGYAPIASPTLTGTPTAPTATAGDNSTQIATDAFVQSTVAPAFHDVGRNLIHNSLFNIAQRGAGPFTAAYVYTLDRWQMAFASDTMSVTQFVPPDLVRTQIGDEAATRGLQNVFTGSAVAAAYNFIDQKIEGVRRLSGKTITVSFWAVAGAALRLGISLDQFAGTGGTPSGSVTGNGAAVTLGTNWARYSLQFTLASTSGWTLGTNGDDCTQLNFWFSSGTTQAARAGNIGVQSGTVELWGVQLEVGSVATPLEKPDPQQDWARCLRFYVASGQVLRVSFYAASSAYSSVFVCLPTVMRIPPIVTLGAVSSPSNWSSSQAIDGDNLRFTLWTLSTAAGSCGAVIAGYTASADL
jgi:hypothetical protein